jgi:predicted component of type VI protein secretion system
VAIIVHTPLKESFLHFIWRWRRFDGADLRTTAGEAVDIVHPGEPNDHAGPDFFNARVRIGDTLWAGNVEMHVLASEWTAHGHQTDNAYQNVVLHVVWKEDHPVLRSDGTPIPCLALEGRVPLRVLHTYEQLLHNQAWIPCASLFPTVPSIIRLNWLDRLLVERLEQKTSAIAQLLSESENHWEAAFYHSLARNFGLKVNAEPFEALARSLPLTVPGRHKNDLLQLEALLFGQAGMLENVVFTEAYPQQLQQEYQHLKNKYSLVPLAVHQWKFARLRPANFPTVRIAQFAALIHQSAHLFSKVLETMEIRALFHLFEVAPGSYWDTHYQLDKASIKREKRLSRDFTELLVINTIAPFLFHYGKAKDDEEYQKRAFYLLEQLPAEENTIVEGWKALDLVCRNAYQSQSAIHLKTRYCDPKRCLSCAIGNALLK